MGKKKKVDLKSLPFKEQIKPVFKERFLSLLNSQEEYNLFEETILQKQRKSFRINIFKVKDIDLVKTSIQAKGIRISQIPWVPEGFFVDYSEDSRSDLGNLYEHFLGEIYVQEATSMCPPLLLDLPEKISEDFKVLDMAAAPGSKTTQIAALMKNRGILVANELDYKRLGPLKLNLERSGFTNIVITNNDGRNLLGENIYDRVLLDAPCSGSGVIRKSPTTLRKYNPKKLKGMQKLQLSLLDRAVDLVKPGGRVVYSTCSLDPEENELCVMKFLESRADIKLLEAKIDGLILNNKVKQFNSVDISQEVYDKTIRIWPQDNDTNGFYIAVFEKLDSSKDII